MNEFTRLIVQQASQAASRLRRVEPGLEFSLNVDPTQLRDAQLQDILVQSVGSDLTGWCIEVTENGFGTGGEAAVRQALETLKRRGASTSLDDFGTGYSSIMQLKSWGFEEVKIDRGFVSDLGGQGSRQLVQTMLSMAAALGARTVAEGVENEEQARLLSALETDLLQGYFFAPPMDVESATEWLKRRREHG